MEMVPPLEGDQIRVYTPGGKQGVMGAGLYDAPLFQNNGPVGVADGGQPVRDDERRTAGAGAGHRLPE